MSERITVLRDGRTVGTEAAEALDEPRVIARMVGREVGDIFPEASHERGEVLFEVRNMTVEDPNLRGKLLVKNVSFSVRRGEVLTHRQPPVAPFATKRQPGGSYAESLVPSPSSRCRSVTSRAFAPS